MSTKHDLLLAALLVYPSVAAAAEACRLSRSTAYRLYQDKDFQADLASARNEAFSQGLTVFQGSFNLAVETVKRIMEHGPLPLQLRAAELWLEFAKYGKQTQDLDARLAALEAALQDYRP